MENSTEKGTSGTRRVETSTHFAIKPAARPADLAGEVLDPRLLGLADQLGKALVGRIRECGAVGWTKLRSAEAAGILLRWCAEDLPVALATVELEALAQLGRRHLAHARAWNRWLSGELGDGAELVRLCWCLGLHPRTIGAVERLLRACQID